MPHVWGRDSGSQRLTVLARVRCRRLAWLAGLLVVQLLVACATSAPAPQPVALGDQPAALRQLQAFIVHEMKAADLTGLSIAVIDDQRTVWAQGFGWADREAARAADADTLYRVGSVTKLFTDTVVMQLAAEQRLDLDAPLQVLLPELRALLPELRALPGAAAITPRQLMTHHAGLPRDLLGGMWSDPAGPMADFRSVPTALAGEALVAEPGQLFEYSNVGLDLLGVAAERADGRPFEALVHERLLQPLGMHDAVLGAAVPAHPHMARAYLGGRLEQEPALRDVPAGGLSSSVNDLARFVAMQFADGRNARGEVVVPAAAQAEMLRRQNADVPLDADLAIGLGWLLSTFGTDTVHGGGPVAHHAGATFFHRTQLMLLPEQRLGVVVASNDGRAGPAVNRIAQRALALLLEARTGRRQGPVQPGWRAAAEPWRPAQRQACLGDYLTPAGLVRVTLAGDQLQARLDERRIELREGADSRLGLRYRLWGWLPLSLGVLEQIGIECTERAGTPVLLAHLDDERLRVGVRLPPAPPLPDDALVLVGRYRVEPLPGERLSLASAAIESSDGRLWLRIELVPALGGQTLRLPVVGFGDHEVALPGSLGTPGTRLHWQADAAGPIRLHGLGMSWVRTDGGR